MPRKKRKPGGRKSIRIPAPLSRTWTRIPPCRSSAPIQISPPSAVNRLAFLTSRLSTWARRVSSDRAMAAFADEVTCTRWLRSSMALRFSSSALRMTAWTSTGLDSRTTSPRSIRSASTTRSSSLSIASICRSMVCAAPRIAASEGLRNRIRCAALRIVPIRLRSSCASTRMKVVPRCGATVGDVGWFNQSRDRIHRSAGHRVSTRLPGADNYTILLNPI